MSVEQRLFDLCTELQAISGKNDKIAFIKKYKDDKDFTLYLDYLLDKLKVYGIQTKKIDKAMKNTKPLDNLRINILNMFEYLLENNTGKDDDAEYVASYILKLPAHLQQWASASITKTLKLGVTAKSVNKALGYNLIPHFEVMLAHSFEKHGHKAEGKTMYVTEKLDGNRATFINDKNGVIGYSRQGKQLEGYSHIEEELKKYPFGVYDGELLIQDADQYKDREVMQQTQSISGSKGDKTLLDFYIFDFVDLEVFKNEKSKYKYKTRREQLDDMIFDISGCLKAVPLLYTGTDMKKVMELLKQLESEGKEGLMINLNGYYEIKRSDQILKLKTFNTFDEYCTGVFEGEGKYTGMLGGIYVDYKGFKLGVGSGFTDEQRKTYWDSPELILDKIVEVKYFRESSNKDGGLSVSFPVFQAIRDDKEEVSYN